MRMRWFTVGGLVLGSAGCNELALGSTDVTDAFQQSPFEKVDVLLVVDNSGSMGPYQAKLATDFGGFFDFFAEGQVDWQLGVTHTDAYAADFGQLRGPIVTPMVDDPEGLFAEVVNVGTDGGGLEAGLEAAERVLRDPASGFPRDDAGISVIFVSDEEDASPDSVPNYVNRFYEVRGPRQRAAFNASSLTVTELADCDPDQFRASSRGTRYVEAARLTGGITANLCLQDFAPIVLDLALTTSTLLDTFILRAQPVPSTLALRVDGVVLPCEEGGWRYDRVDRDGVPVPAILFDADRVPAPGAQVLVEYQRGAGEPADFCPAAAP